MLRAFYSRWYRPDRMALVVVGDIDPAVIEKQVASMFGGMKKPATEPPARSYDVPLHTELLVEVATDPEATQSSVSVMRKRKKLSDDTVADYRRGLAEQMVFQMLNERFDELSRKPEAQFLGAGAYESSPSPAVAVLRSARASRTAESRRGSPRSRSTNRVLPAFHVPHRVKRARSEPSAEIQ